MPKPGGGRFCFPSFSSFFCVEDRSSALELGVISGVRAGLESVLNTISSLPPPRCCFCGCFFEASALVLDLAGGLVVRVLGGFASAAGRFCLRSLLEEPLAAE
eukprot:Lithocolla_globosa_v1_NODE_4489_length_1423_cov_3.383772.p2 type:complete len:103 gc:universal NODE_4489_length_1423_cov_3.383772:365-673(+)